MNSEIGYCDFEEAIRITKLKPFVLKEICRNANPKGLAYLSKDDIWMLHPTLIDDLVYILSGTKDFAGVEKK